MSKPIHICLDCKTKGVLTQQAFTPYEISWIISCHVSMMKHLATLSAAKVSIPVNAVLTLEAGQNVFRKLMLAIPQPEREVALRQVAQQTGMEYVMEGCEENAPAPTTH